MTDHFLNISFFPIERSLSQYATATKKNLQSGWWDVPHISDYSGFLLGRVDAFDWTQTVCFPTNESSFSKFLKWPEVSKTTHRWEKQCIYSPCAFFFFPFPQQQSQKNRCQTREIGILNSHRQVWTWSSIVTSCSGAGRRYVANQFLQPVSISMCCSCM